MIDTDFSLLLALILFVVLVVFDLVFYRFRHTKSIEDETEFSPAREIWQRVKTWAGQLRGPAAPPAPQAQALPLEATTETPVSEPALPARDQEIVITELAAPESAQTASPVPTVHVQISADIPEGTVVHVTMQVVNREGKVVLQQAGVAGQARPDLPSSLPLAGVGQWVGTQIDRIKRRAPDLHLDLFWASIIAYITVLAIGIERFPIYFFTDEAIHMNMIADFLSSGFKNYDGEFLPTFFTLEGWVNGTSVYVQLIPYLLFGKSVIATRLTSAVITMLGAIAIGLLLKKVFKIKYYWVGVFFLLTTPAWFLHARTAFEYAEVAAFYCIFLYCYGRYRDGNLKYLYFAVIAGALCFYTHGLGQILMSVTGFALFVVDFRYHIHPDQRKTVLLSFGLALLLLLPFARYYLAHPTEAAEQVKRRGSYWSDSSLTSLDKLSNFGQQYLYGLNPLYWYLPNNTDIDRHTMLNYGNGLLLTFPLMLAGLVQVIRNIRKPASRLVLIALLACPFPASVVAIGMPRMLWMAVPLAILTAIGLSAIIEWIETRWKITSSWPAWVTFAVLALLSVHILTDALTNGPTWFQDYGLYGMQYGAQQIFGDTVRPALEQNPNLLFVVSPSWANGTEQFTNFFIPKELQSRVILGQPVDHINDPSFFNENTRFVSTANEYNNLFQDPKLFKDIQIVGQPINYPNGQPGFYVITLKPADNFNELINEQHQRNRTPIEDTMLFNGQTIRVVHSPLGSGQMDDIFDNNPDTLARVLEANPFVIDLYPTTPVPTGSVFFKTGSMTDFTITIRLYAPGATQPVEYSQTYNKDLPPDPEFTITFDKGPETSERIEIEVRDNTSGDTSQIHLRTIQFNK